MQHAVSDLILAAGMATVGLPIGAVFGHDSNDDEPFAMVRFVNNTPGLATLSIAGKGVFLGVPTGKVTDYAVVSRRVVAFTLLTLDPLRPPLTVDQRIEDGAHYTVTARSGRGGEATLMIAAEQPLTTQLQPEW